MHELSLAASLIEEVETILEREGAARVVSISVSIGELSGVEAEAFEYCFPIAAGESRLAESELKVEIEKAKLRCAVCGEEEVIEIPVFACVACGAEDVAVIAGKDFVIKSVELET